MSYTIKPKGVIFVKKGIKAWILMGPIIIAIVIMQIGLIVNANVINRYSDELSTELTRTTSNTNQITALQTSSSLLAETSSSFVYRPYIEPIEQINADPLVAYATEISNSEHKPETILASLKQHGIDEDIYDIISETAEYIREMIKTQFHAIALVRSEYNIKIQVLESIPNYDLTQEELALTKEEKLQTALDLLYSKEYSSWKKGVSQNISKVYEMINERANIKETKLDSQIIICKRLNYIFIIVITILILSFFVIIVVFVLLPLSRSIRTIENDELMQERGLYETRVVARTYNELHKKKQIYEKHLEESVETDSLTGLKSRYLLNQIFQQPVGPTSVVLFVFDINYLKETNDTYGHDVGDKLIVRASNSIIRSFNINDSFSAYRFGGDEFVAILNDVTEEDIKEAIEFFKKDQEKNNVSVAYGYEYETDGTNTSYSQLFKRADRNMYFNKQKDHKQNDNKE